MEKGQNGSFKGQKDIKGHVDSPEIQTHLGANSDFYVFFGLKPLFQTKFGPFWQIGPNSDPGPNFGPLWQHCIPNFLFEKSRKAVHVINGNSCAHCFPKSNIAYYS